MGFLGDWKLALARSLKLPALKRVIVELKQQNGAVRQDVAELRVLMRELRTLMEEQELRAAGWQAMSVNNQLKLESAVGELSATVRELSAFLNGKHSSGPQEEKGADTLAQLAAEVRGLSDVIHRQALSATPRSSND